ncbi:MAG: YtxH domain-containing protein [Flavobacteriales bacterium]
MNNTGKVFFAALTGAVAGGVAGVLLAPEKGEETRKKLTKEAQKAREELNDLVEKGKDTVEDLKKNKVGSNS